MHGAKLCLLTCLAFGVTATTVFASSTTTPPTPDPLAATTSSEVLELPVIDFATAAPVELMREGGSDSGGGNGGDDGPPPPPLGASSILFLPGIMGSHLYEEDDACFGQGEQRRWFSFSGCDQERLFLDSDGNSWNDIYTKFEDESVIASIVNQSLYGSFIDRFSALEGTTIDSFVPFPYDWRLRLEDILRAQVDAEGRVRVVPVSPIQNGLLYNTLAEMSATSYSGKVTIVAHSNGGLVAKAFMAELQAAGDPLVEVIDAVVLIGSPQVGTPDAVNGLLQGTEIGDGWVVSQETARTLLNNAPFGYHLLPNEQYFAGEGVTTETPVIVFDEGAATDAYRAQFGASIDSAEALELFLSSGSGREKPAPTDLSKPEVGVDILLSYAETVTDSQVVWKPLPETKVYQLAGTGLWTPKTLRYYTGTTCVRERLFGRSCDTYEPSLAYELYFTREGDATVVVPSAVAMAEAQNVERWWVDLYEYNDANDSGFVHRNLSEIDVVQDFVLQIAQGANPTENSFITADLPDLADEHFLVYHLHSPLDLSLESSAGDLSSTTNSLPGGTYRRFGEVQYLIFPADTPASVVKLAATGSGSFTLVAEEWVGEEVRELADYRAIPTATTTRVTLEVEGDKQLQVDFDGDGTVDGVVDSESDVLLCQSSGLVNLSKKVVKNETALNRLESVGVMQRWQELLGKVNGRGCK